MNFQKAKSIIIFIIIISVIAGITYFITVSAYLPKLEQEIINKKDNELQWKMVTTAARDIPMGAVIAQEDLTISKVPFNNVVDGTKIYTDIGLLIGKVASVNIYKGEQILNDKILSEVEFAPEDWKTLEQVPKRKFEASYRYITVDIPRYNFVNERVGVNSLVDILLDKGQGRYDVVLAKISILDKVPIASSSDNNQQNATAQIKRPLPKPLLLQQQEQGVFPGTATQLLMQNNPSMEDTPDYRITIMVTEKENKRLFEAMTYGKFMLRKYVFPSQPASIVTFTGSEQAKVVRDGTVEIPKPVVPKQDTTLGNTLDNNSLINVGPNTKTPVTPETPLRSQ